MLFIHSLSTLLETPVHLFMHEIISRVSRILIVACLLLTFWLVWIFWSTGIFIHNPKVDIEWCDERKNHPVSSSSADGSALLIIEVKWECPDTFRWQKGYNNLDSHSFSIFVVNMLKLQADGLQHQKTSSVSQEQKAQSAVGGGSQKLDSLRLETLGPALFGMIRIWCQTMDPTCLV